MAKPKKAGAQPKLTFREEKEVRTGRSMAKFPEKQVCALQPTVHQNFC